VASVADALPAALVLAGPSGLIELANRQAERMFGYDHEELVGMPLESLMPERFRQRGVGSRDAGRDAIMTGPRRDLFGIRKDGTEFSVEIGLNPIDLGGQAMVLVEVTDVTARPEAEREQEAHRLKLEQSNADLARSNADLEEFAYLASHDLKAPLRAISHLVEWITEDVAATASADTIDKLRLLRGRVVRLQTLLDGLLAYSRVGRTTASYEVVDIAELVSDIVAVLSPPPGFVVACEGKLPPLRVHRSSIQVVLQNVISNALKHHDRTEGRVAVAMRLENGVATFRIRDDGPGILPRFHDRIFVIFQTLESRDDVDSSGIGLAIVKKRVESHGGKIWVESAPPARGSTFVFTWSEHAA
jgi:PAS domain S-box-containing protein